MNVNTVNKKEDEHMSEFVASFDKQVSINQLRALRDAVNGEAQLTMPDPFTVHVTPFKGAKQGVIKNDLTKAAHKMGMFDIKYHRLAGNEKNRTRVSPATKTAPKQAATDKDTKLPLIGHEKADRVLRNFVSSVNFKLATHQKRVDVLKADLDELGVKCGRGAAYVLADEQQAVNPVAMLNNVLCQVTAERDKLLHDAEAWWAEELTVAQLNRLRIAADSATAEAKLVLTDMYTKLQRAQRTAHCDWLLRSLEADEVKQSSPLSAAFAEVYAAMQADVLDEMDTDYDEAKVLEMTADRVEQLWPVVRKAVVAAQTVK